MEKLNATKKVAKQTDLKIISRFYLSKPSASFASSAVRIRVLAPDMHHGPRRRHEIGLANVMPFFLLHHDTADKLLELFIAGAAPHLRMQVVIPLGKKAGANL